MQIVDVSVFVAYTVTFTKEEGSVITSVCFSVCLSFREFKQLQAGSDEVC